MDAFRRAVFALPGNVLDASWIKKSSPNGVSRDRSQCRTYYGAVMAEQRSERRSRPWGVQRGEQGGADGPAAPSDGSDPSPPSPLRIEEIAPSDLDGSGLFSFRRLVFVDEQGATVPVVDGGVHDAIDAVSRHFVAKTDGALVGALRLSPLEVLGASGVARVAERLRAPDGRDLVDLRRAFLIDRVAVERQSERRVVFDSLLAAAADSIVVASTESRALVTDVAPRHARWLEQGGFVVLTRPYEDTRFGLRIPAVAEPTEVVSAFHRRSGGTPSQIPPAPWRAEVESASAPWNRPWARTELALRALRDSHFERCSDATRALLASEAFFIELPAGAHILRRGLFDDGLYLVESGSVVVDPDVQRVSLESFGNGAVFGGVAVPLAVPRAKGAVAASHTRLLVLGSGTLRRAAVLDPSLERAPAATITASMKPVAR